MQDCGYGVVTEQARTEHTEHTARIAQLNGDLHKLNGKLDFSERRNSVAVLQYFILTDE